MAQDADDVNRHGTADHLHDVARRAGSLRGLSGYIAVVCFVSFACADPGWRSGSGFVMPQTCICIVQRFTRIKLQRKLHFVLAVSKPDGMRLRFSSFRLADVTAIASVC